MRSTINEQILSNLDALNKAHLENRPICFAKGLPFYTCVDSAKDLYTKETKDGGVLLVRRKFDFEKDMAKEVVIKRIK